MQYCAVHFHFLLPPFLWVENWRTEGNVEQMLLFKPLKGLDTEQTWQNLDVDGEQVGLFHICFRQAVSYITMKGTADALVLCWRVCLSPPYTSARKLHMLLLVFSLACVPRNAVQTCLEIFITKKGSFVRKGRSASRVTRPTPLKFGK